MNPGLGRLAPLALGAVALGSAIGQLTWLKSEGASIRGDPAVKRGAQLDNTKVGTLRIDSTGGGSFILEGQLILNAATVANGVSFGPNREEVFAPNSLVAHLDAVTPHTAYGTESGTTYRTPAAVPEPLSLVLFSTGLLGLFSCGAIGRSHDLRALLKRGALVHRV